MEPEKIKTRSGNGNRMKAKKIYRMRKESKSVLVCTAEDGRQFFTAGGCMYLIDGMPVMGGTEFLAYLDVPKKDRDEWDVIEDGVDAELVSDAIHDDRELKPHPVSVICNGRHMIAFLTEDGAVLWLDEDKLSPLAAAAWRFFLRANENGETYIAVFEGLYLIALLSYELTPEVMPGEGLAQRLMELAGVKEESDADCSDGITEGAAVLDALKERYHNKEKET
jgi:hypothetical protein